MNTCHKCHGSGNVGYRRAGGVCFRCNGTGSILSESSHEAAASINATLARSAQTYAPAEMPAEIALDPNWLLNLFAGGGTVEESGITPLPAPGGILQPTP
jgi:hypothetical protein